VDSRDSQNIGIEILKTPTCHDAWRDPLGCHRLALSRAFEPKPDNVAVAQLVCAPHSLKGSCVSHTSKPSASMPKIGQAC
jgi:hypothetical protein